MSRSGASAPDRSVEARDRRWRAASPLPQMPTARPLGRETARDTSSRSAGRRARYAPLVVPRRQACGSFRFRFDGGSVNRRPVRIRPCHAQCPRGRKLHAPGGQHEAGPLAKRQVPADLKSPPRVLAGRHFLGVLHVALRYEPTKVARRQTDIDQAIDLDGEVPRAAIGILGIAGGAGQLLQCRLKFTVAVGRLQIQGNTGWFVMGSRRCLPIDSCFGVAVSSR